MGWKAIKEHYRIEHLVHVREGLICIGSPFIPDIIKLNQFGQFVKRYEHGSILSKNDLLSRYMAEMEADPDKCRELAQAEDTFAVSIPVYTYDIYDEARIIECACEELGYPNVTHDGQLMYNNTFSPDRAQVVKWAIENARAWVEALKDRQTEAQENLLNATDRLRFAEFNCRRLMTAEGTNA